MTEIRTTTTVQVTHRFAAPAERVYDAFLDPAKAAQFLFATGTGQIVRCDIDPRIGGTFTIVDRRNGEDVAHTGNISSSSGRGESSSRCRSKSTRVTSTLWR